MEAKATTFFFVILSRAMRTKSSLNVCTYLNEIWTSSRVPSWKYGVLSTRLCAFPVLLRTMLREKQNISFPLESPPPLLNVSGDEKGNDEVEEDILWPEAFEDIITRKKERHLLPKSIEERN